MITLRAKTRRLAAASLAVLICGATTPALAAGHNYKGKTEQGPKVTFSATAKKVKGFKTSASVLCVSVVTGRSVLDIYPVLLQSPTPLKKGKFTIVFTGENGTRITAKGKVTGNTAKGSLDIGYNKVIGSTPAGLLDIAACLASTTWTAKQK